MRLARQSKGASTASRHGLVWLAVVVLAWGSVWPVNKVVLASVPPLWTVSIRCAIAALALFAISAVRRRVVVPGRADLPVVLSMTLLHMVGFAVLSSLGLRLVPTGRSVVLAYTTPLWVVPAAALFLGERFTARRMVGVAAGLLGLAVLFNPLALDWGNREIVWGNLVILAAALLWAGSIVHTRSHHWVATPFELVPWQTLLAALLILPLALAIDGVPDVAWDGRLALLMVYAGVPGTAVAYWAMAMAGKNLPAITTSLGLLGTPVVTIVLATWWLGEAPTLSLLTAVVLILGGVAIGTMDSTRRSR